MSENHTEMKETDALIIVDVQNCFFPGGNLGIERAEEVVPVLNRWTQKAVSRNATVYASRDWHPAGHVSFTGEGGQWPPHCIQHTEAARFRSDLKLPDDVVIITKGVRLDKDQESVFDETGLAAHLEKKGINRVFVGGLALDVCVLKTVLDARKAGFETILLFEATRPVSEEAGKNALAKISEAGAIINYDSLADDLEVCETSPEYAEHARMNKFQDACDDGRSGKI